METTWFFLLTIFVGIILMIILTGFYAKFKKRWIFVISRLSFYLPMLAMIFYVFIYFVCIIKYPLIFGNTIFTPKEASFLLILVAVAFVILVYNFYELFEPKAQRDGKLRVILESEIKATEKRLETLKKELSDLTA